MNHYEILGVSAEATDQQIKEGYRREAMKWHPDRHEGAAAKANADKRFKDLALAYRTLRDPTSRREYDDQLAFELHQEYETSQRERARQGQEEQRNQEQARQQKHEHRERRQHDSAGTRPPFDESMSGADADQMFREQMLDLATELAGRGFPQFNIFRALVALGCPEKMAQAVAAIAASKDSTPKTGDRPESKSNAEGSSQHSRKEKSDGFIVRPRRFLTILGALFGLASIAYSAYAWMDAYSGISWSGSGYMGVPNSIWQIFHQYVGGPFGAACLVFWGQISSANVLMIIETDGIRFTRRGGQLTKWSEIDHFSFDGKKLKFSGIKDRKKWSEQFPRIFVSTDCNEIVERTHKLKFGQSLSPESSQNQVKRKSFPFVSLLIAVPLVGILAAIGLPAYQDYKQRAKVASGFAAGTEAGKAVSDYVVAKGKGPPDLLSAGFTVPPSDAVKNITFDKQAGLITITFHDRFFDNKALLLVPSVADDKVTWLCTSEGIAKQLLPSACRETQVAADAKLDAIKVEVQRQVNTNAEYAKAVAAIEKQHPELNPDSAQYNSGSLDWVASKKKMYQERGNSPINAIQLAVADYGAALESSRRTQTENQVQKLRMSDSATFFGGAGKRVSLNFRNIEIRPLLQVFSDFSGYRFIVAEDVQVSVNIRTYDQPWTQELFQMLNQNRLAVIKVSGNYYVFHSSLSDEEAFRQANR